MDIKALGKRGEEIAGEYLLDKGYRLVTTNFRNRLGEVDLIAIDPNYNETVFVEVKTRRTQTYGTPEEAVDGLKLHKIVKVAESYMQTHAGADDDWRVDIISIAHTGGGLRIDHLENVGEN